MIEIKVPTDSYKEFPGPILILAGPGTGKTFQLALRIKYLINELEAKPDEIAVITFTNEAARNMRERLTSKDIYVPREKHPEIISTMHSLGNTIIGSNPARFGLKEDYEVLYEKNHRIVLLQDATTIAGFDRDKWKLVDNCRRKGNCKEDRNEDKCKICKEYRKILRKCSRVDYDDQILLACKTLKNDNIFKNYWKKRTKFLLVDEYQDINQAQCEFIQLLTEDQTDGLFVVGDDDQSIYSFRGGSTKFIQEFENYFGNKAKLGLLSKSYRCPEYILKGAKAMVSSSYKKSIPKPDPTFDEKIKVNNKIVFYDVSSDTKEAQIIAAISKKKIKTDTVTIIIPNKMYLPKIKKSLTKVGLDYKYKFDINEEGLIRFLVLADWVEKPNSNLHLRYLIDLIINNLDELTNKIETEDSGIKCKRYVASQFIANLWKKVNDKDSLYQVISSKAKNKDNNSYLFELKNCLEDIFNILKNKGNKKDGLQPFLEKSGLFVAPCKNPNGIISEVREWRNELVGSKKVSSYNPVNIYNMPSSKGLEGDIIFVIGLSKKLFPNLDYDIEEQGRLFYVAMTRAKKELYLFSSRTRSAKVTFEKCSYQLKKSPFIEAIPKEFIEIKPIYPKKQ